MKMLRRSSVSSNGRSKFLPNLPGFPSPSDSCVTCRLGFHHVPRAFDNPDGHTLNIENPTELRRYLVAANLVAEGEQISIVVLPGGVSSRTVLVERPVSPS